MNITEVLGTLKDTPPLVLLILLVGWVIHRTFSFLEKRGEDDRFLSLRKAQETLHSNLVVIASEIHSQHDDKMQIGEKQVDVLERVEAHLITAGSSFRCPQSGTAGCAQDDYRMPASSQRHIIHYQWSWCRDEVISILSASIRKNGIKDNPGVIARRVFQSCRNAINEAKGSLDRLVGLSYPYEDLFTDPTELLLKVWDLSTPIYHREFVGCLDICLDEFSFRVEGLFEERIQRHFTAYDDDPDTNTYRKEDQRSDEWDIVALMAERLKNHPGPHPAIQSALESKETPPGACLESPDNPVNQNPPLEGAQDHKEH